MCERIIIVIFGMLACMSQLCMAVGQGTSPIGANRRGLVRSPNPIDRSSNLVVTGNVAGGKHFRGTVPYSTTDYFNMAVPSSSLDSFLRRTAGTGIGDNFGRYEPFYSPSRTVTSVRSSMRGAIESEAVGIDGRVSRDLNQLGDFGRVRSLPPSVLRSRPLSRTTDRIAKTLEGERDFEATGRRLTAEQSRQEIEGFKLELKKAAEKADELVRKIVPEEQSQFQQPQNIQKPARSAADIFELMKRQLESTRKQEKARTSETETGEDETQADTQEETVESGQIDLGQIVEARSILGEHKTFAAFSQDRFNRYMKAAEEYLAEGKYYRAADSYTIAAVYKPQDPLAYAGKSHALFAAGEYMSSALFLSRAMEIFPEYAGFKINLEAMFGNRDKIESRIVDIEKWLERNDAPELQFLLGYLYFQLGRNDVAYEAILAAYEKMPESKAVTALKSAIEAVVK